MARIDTLGNFLTDVANAIRTKEGTTETIAADEFDTRILNLSGDGGDSSDISLPAGYSQLEYVTSTGEQYIDTGFTPTEKTDFEVTFVTHNTFGASGNFGSIFGVRYTYNENAYHLGTFDSADGVKTGVGCFIFGNTFYTGHMKTDGTKQTVSLKSGIYTGGDGTTTDLSSVVTSPSENLHLFVTRDTLGQTYLDYGSLDMYRCTFYENGNKIRDFIPVVKNNDGGVGFLDIVNNVFYTSDSGVELVAGPVIDSGKNLLLQEKDLTITSNGKQTITFDDGFDGLGSVNITTSVVGDDDTIVGVLPTGYVRLRYLQSSDKQYINTGIKPNANTGFDIDYMVYDQLSSNDTLAGALLGGRNSYYSNALALTTYSAGSYTKGHLLYGSVSNSGYVDRIRNNAGITPGKREQISFRNGVLTQPDGTEVTLNVNEGLSCNYPMYIFALNESNRAVEYSTARIYGLKLYDGNTLVRNYVPALEKLTGTPGLYDLVTESFETGVTNGYPFSYAYAEDVDMPLYSPKFFTFQGYLGSDLSYEVANISTVNMTSFLNNSFGLFNSCSGLKSLDLSNWDTSNVTNMQSTFSNCSKLASLDVSGWDTSKVTTMAYMFYGCQKMTRLDLSSWHTPNLTNTSYMFYCGSSNVWEHIDMRNFDFSKVTSSSDMFGSKSYHFKTNCEIIVKDETAKQWILGVRSDLSNVKTVEEYEAEQSA